MAASSIASKIARKKLTNLYRTNDLNVLAITAQSAIPEDLKREIERAKKLENRNTFYKTAAVACAIASSLHGVKLFTHPTVSTKEIPQLATVALGSVGASNLDLRPIPETVEEETRTAVR